MQFTSEKAVTLKRSTVAIVIYFLALVVATARELLDLVAPSVFSYAAQFAALLCAAIALRGLFGALGRVERMIFAVAVFAASVSAALTVALRNVPVIAVLAVSTVNVINVYFLALASHVHRSQDRLPGSVAVMVWKLARIISIWVATFALLQYFDVVQFAGSYRFAGRQRLTGALGSMQHLSIVLAILSVLFIARAEKTRRPIDIATCVLLMGTLLVSLTRIGYLIVGVTLAIYLLRMVALVQLRRIIPVALIAAPIFASVVVVVAYSGVLDDVLLRLAGMSLAESSNQERIWHWSAGYRKFTDGLLIVGSWTGFASQIPRIAFGMDSAHYESGQLQYLINFGVIFWLAIGLLFWRWYKALPSSSLGRGLVPALWLALFIYMFNEIVPVFVLFPLVTLALHSLDWRVPAKRPSVPSAAG